VLVSRSGLVTVTGGKWTTYRAMAEDVLGKCMADALLPHRPGGATLKQLLVGANAGASNPHPLSRRAICRPTAARLRPSRLCPAPDGNLQAG
jgi:glycerol-3-phosphate dehydrogenase